MAGGSTCDMCRSGKAVRHARLPWIPRLASQRDVGVLRSVLPARPNAQVALALARLLPARNRRPCPGLDELERLVKRPKKTLVVSSQQGPQGVMAVSRRPSAAAGGTGPVRRRRRHGRDALVGRRLPRRAEAPGAQAPRRRLLRREGRPRLIHQSGLVHTQSLQSVRRGTALQERGRASLEV